jgi:hypothetical protein
LTFHQANGIPPPSVCLRYTGRQVRCSCATEVTPEIKRAVSPSCLHKQTPSAVISLREQVRRCLKSEWVTVVHSCQKEILESWY